MAQAVESNHADRIVGLLGADRVRSPIGPEARAANTIVEPASVEEVAELVRACEADNLSLAPLGAARTLAQIRRTPVAVGLSLARLARIVAYESDDMTIVAEAGLSVAELNRATSRSGQRLPADPRGPEATTLGALVAAAHAGPLRHSDGSARDLLIGIHFVGHGGKLVRGGGRVVKNVAGYDLMKVMGGSFGTLGIIVETTFKVRPLLENYSVAIAGYDRSGAAFDAARALNDALPLAHLEVVSPALAAAFQRSGSFLVIAGFYGNRREIDYQRDRLTAIAATRVEFLTSEAAETTYAQVRDLDLPQASLAARIAVLPGELGTALEACGVEFVAHAGSGVAEIFAPLLSADTARETLARWRTIAHRARGNVRVLAAASELRDSLVFFDEPGDGALKLMRRLKAAFDPANIFNPGCFVGGI
ncbi:MAG TPA: FAD-binding oxidoreductase [Candidatus Binataceae bacterium]